MSEPAKELRLPVGDLAAILGRDRFRTPLMVYNRRLGLDKPTPDHSGFRWGRRLEVPIGEAVGETEGLAITPRDYDLKADELERHPDHEWLVGRLDADVEGSTQFEGVGVGEWKKYQPRDSEQVEEWRRRAPVEPLVQVQGYMAITGRSYGVVGIAPVNGGAFLAALDALADVEHLTREALFREIVRRSGVIVHYVPRHDEFIDTVLIPAGLEFMRRIREQDPPPATPADVAALSTLYPKPTAEGAATLDDDLVTAFEHVSKMRRAFSATEDECKARILEAIGEHDSGETPGGKVYRWTGQRKPASDAHKLAKALRLELQTLRGLLTDSPTEGTYAALTRTLDGRLDELTDEVKSTQPGTSRRLYKGRRGSK